MLHVLEQIGMWLGWAAFCAGLLAFWYFVITRIGER
jgi:hypothetical protein